MNDRQGREQGEEERDGAKRECRDGDRHAPPRDQPCSPFRLHVATLGETPWRAKSSLWVAACRRAARGLAMAMLAGEPSRHAAEAPASASAPVLQRARGRAEITVGIRHGRTRLADLHQSGCLKLRLPRAPGAVPEAVLINTAGGLTGGDRLHVEATVRDGARLALATQTAERLYRSPRDHALIDVSLRVGRGAALSWLPQETIAFEGSALRRRLDVELAEDAGFLAVEPLVLGREAMGESLARAEIRDDWRVQVGGRLLHAEALRLGPEARPWIERRAGWGGMRAGATVLLVGAAAPRALEGARFLTGAGGAADLWPGGALPPRLVVRLLGADGLAMRRVLLPLLAHLHGHLQGHLQGQLHGHLHAAAMGIDCPEAGQTAALPRVWAL